MQRLCVVRNLLRRQIRSLRFKLTAIIALPMVLLVSLVVTWAAHLHTAQLKQETVAAMDSIVRALQQDIEELHSSGDQRLAADAVQRLKSFPQIERAFAIDVAGDVFFSYLSPHAVSRVPPAFHGSETHFSGGSLHVWRDMTSSSKPFGSLYLESSTSHLRASRSASNSFAIVVCLMTGLVSTLLAICLQSVISRPILSLKQSTEAVARDGDLSIRARRTSSDEVGQLVDAFNHMLERTQVAEEQLKLVNEQLESRVDDRTKQLNETVRRLSREVDEHKKTQAERDSAESANVAKSQFLASMSHELRTPLNGVIGMTELLAGTDLNEKQQQFVDACRNSGESLLQLINDILDFSKIEAGKLELDLHDFDLEKLVTDTADTMSWRAADKNLELPCRVDQMARLVLHGDSRRLRQVLVNLIGNAIKFTQAGEVAVRTQMLKKQDDRITVRFSVADTGIGIPADKLDRLFCSFSQVDASTTRKYGGTGLGLAISQSLVELMGGTIGVESEEGVGSTFWFELSLTVSSESTESPPETSPLAGLRALIVDDNETNRIILTDYAAEWDLDSVATASVDAAITAVEHADADDRPFQVVLTDYNMPQRDGLELARALKHRPRMKVMLLGSTDVHLNPAELREAGIEATMRKPIRRHELHEVICGLISANGEAHNPTVSESSSEAATVLPGRHILLAEDNSINQMYVIELMKQLGCTCDTAANGHEAVEAIQRGNYDLVLMDCQMPEMDGFEATRRIRQLESDGVLKGHLAVVALTANAVKGDRQRCLDAGMDDYLSKPVQKQQVVAMFEQFFSGPRNSAAEAKSTIAADDGTRKPTLPAPIDADSLWARCFGNLEFAGSLLDELESTGFERVAEIRRHIALQDAQATAEAAHSLKGAAGILCAESVQQLAAEIEQAGRSSTVHTLEDQIADLTAEMQRCLDYLPLLRQKLNSVQ